MVLDRLLFTLARLTGTLVIVAATCLASPAGQVSADEEEPTPTPTASATRKPAATPTATPAVTSAPQSTDATPTPTATPTPEPPPLPPVYPLAVIVDNYPSSRPQSGLFAADVVYEALAEGGITRFLAIYASRDAELVGPVRSARHYYVYWAAEYNAPLVHVMASDEGYAALVNTGLPDLDEHRGDPGFVRSEDRRPPYNAYTSPAFDRQILASQGALWPGSLGGLQTQPKARSVRGKGAIDVQLSYPPSDYSVEWTYDRALQRYVRFEAGIAHVDAATGEQLSAVNVIVQFVPAWQYEFQEGYLDMQLTGAGPAVYFQGGVAVEGAWLRESLGEHTQYFGPSGELIPIRSGPTWIQVMPTGPIEGTIIYSATAPSMTGGS